MATQSRALVESMRRQFQVRHSYGTKSRAWCWRVWGDGRVRNKRVSGSYCQLVRPPFSSQDKRRSSMRSCLELVIGSWWPTHEQTTKDNAVLPPNPPAVNSSAEKGWALRTNPCLTDKPSLAPAQQIPSQHHLLIHKTSKCPLLPQTTQRCHIQGGQKQGGLYVHSFS